MLISWENKEKTQRELEEVSWLKCTAKMNGPYEIIFVLGISDDLGSAFSVQFSFGIHEFEK